MLHVSCYMLHDLCQRLISRKNAQMDRSEAKKNALAVYKQLNQLNQA